MRSEDYMVAASKTDPLNGYWPEGAIAERVASVEVLRLLHYAMGVCTEAGELLDVAKRALVYGAPIDWVNVVEEVGDLQWYEARMLDLAGSSFSEAMDRNVAKLHARFPDGFTEHDAQVRDLDAEREVLEGQAFLSASLEERTQDMDLDVAVESLRALSRKHSPTASEWKRSVSWDERRDSPGMVRLCLTTGDIVAFVRDDGSGMAYGETSAEFPVAARKETAALCDAHLRRDGWVLTAQPPVVPLRSDLALKPGDVFNVICLEKYEPGAIVDVADPLYRWMCLVESCLPHGSKYLVQLKALSVLEAIPATKALNPCSAPDCTGHPVEDDPSAYTLKYEHTLDLHTHSCGLLHKGDKVASVMKHAPDPGTPVLLHTTAGTWQSVLESSRVYETRMVHWHVVFKVGDRLTTATAKVSDPIEDDLTLTPAHYQGEREVIDLIRDSMDDHAFAGFCQGNALKYAHRAGKKGQLEQDQAKAEWYRTMQAHVRSIDNPDPRGAREDWEAWRDDYERKGGPTLLHPLLTPEGEASTAVLLDPGRGGVLPDGAWALSFASHGQVATFTGGEDGRSTLKVKKFPLGYSAKHCDTEFSVHTTSGDGQCIADLARLAAIGEALVRDIASPGAEDEAVKHATVEETLAHVRQAMTAWCYNQGKE